MASVVISGDTSGSVTLSAPAVAGTTTLTLPSTSGTVLTTGSTTGISGSAISTGTVAEAYGGTGTNTGYYGFKNRILNGAMVIDQRNAGASVTPTNGVYSVDRWKCLVTQASKYTVQQNAGSVTPPAGYTKYLGATSSSAYSVVTGDYFVLYQIIEGLNVSDLAWGSASAVPVSLSFWVRSSLTGTLGGSVIATGGSNYSYPFTFTVSSANTWEYKTISVPANTYNTINTDTNGGVQVVFNLGTGTTYSGTANTWQSGYFLAPTGATSVVGTNGATFYITGVQLEKGSTATSFDYRPYGTELALCERYYWKSTVGTYNAVGSGVLVATTQAVIYIKYPTTMRSAPTLSYSGTVYVYAISNQVVTAISASYAGNSSGRFDFTPTAAMTAGTGAILFTEQTGNNFIQATAEL